jgi:copper(I)-binding protein
VTLWAFYPKERNKITKEKKMNERARTILMAMVWVLVALPVSLEFSGCQRVPPKISIHDAKVEFSKAMKDEALISLRIDNKGGADKLLGAAVSIPDATADIHKMTGMVMTIATEFDIPANSTTDFRSGSSHIMITGLPIEVEEGYRFTLTLKFEKTGPLSIPLTFTTPRPQPVMGS